MRHPPKRKGPPAKWTPQRRAAKRSVEAQLVLDLPSPGNAKVASQIRVGGPAHVGQLLSLAVRGLLYTNQEGQS